MILKKMNNENNKELPILDEFLQEISVKLQRFKANENETNDENDENEENEEKLQQNPKWTLLEDNIHSLILEDMFLLIITGEAGMGKSFKVEEILQKEIPNDYVFFNCHITPLQFFIQLQKMKDKEVIIFDDIDTQDDKAIISLIKSACWNPKGGERKVKWHTSSLAFSRLKINQEFVLKAKIILIFNNEKTSKEFLPVLNRGIHLPFNFTFEEKIREFEKLVKPKIVDKEVLNYIKKNCNAATTGLSIRTIEILSNKKRSKTDWEGTARTILKTDQNKEQLIKMMINNPKKKVIEICKDWCKLTGYGEKTFYNWKKQLIDNEKKIKHQGEAIKLLQPIEKEDNLTKL